MLGKSSARLQPGGNRSRAELSAKELAPAHVFPPSAACYAGREGIERDKDSDKEKGLRFGRERDLSFPVQLRPLRRAATSGGAILRSPPSRRSGTSRCGASPPSRHSASPLAHLSPHPFNPQEVSSVVSSACLSAGSQLRLRPVSSGLDSRPRLLQTSNGY
ncbi:unnamed protein product [Urochloa humidicola]